MTRWEGIITETTISKIWLEELGEIYVLHHRHCIQKQGNKEIWRTDSIVMQRHEALELALRILEKSSPEDAKAFRIIDVKVKTPKEKKRRGAK